MTLFSYLQLQEVEPEDAASPLDVCEEDVITLDDNIDGDALDASWRTIMKSEGLSGE